MQRKGTFLQCFLYSKHRPTCIHANNGLFQKGHWNSESSSNLFESITFKFQDSTFGHMHTTFTNFAYSCVTVLLLPLCFFRSIYLKFNKCVLMRNFSVMCLTWGMLQLRVLNALFTSGSHWLNYDICEQNTQAPLTCRFSPKQDSCLLLILEHHRVCVSEACLSTSGKPPRQFLSLQETWLSSVTTVLTTPPPSSLLPTWSGCHPLPRPSVLYR